MNQEDVIVTAGAGGGGGGRTPVEDPDSLQSRAMVSIIDLLGEGQIGGLVNGAKSIYFNGTPLENNSGTRNFQGVTFETRSGQQAQTPLSGFPDTESPTAVGVKVSKLSPAVITINNSDVDGVRLIVTCPALSFQDADDGDIHGASVSFRFEVSINGGAYQPLSGDLTISGKTRSRYQRAYYYDLPKQGGAAVSWTIRMTRLTDDSPGTNTQNDTYLDSFYEVLNARLTYPNSALIGIKIDSQQFGSIPERAYLIDGLIIRVPSNYDTATRTYSGVWNGTFKLAVSNNPAWILYDILLNKRYGLGQYLSASNIDSAKLYAIGKYCDERVPDGFGGTEPRFVINTSINSQVEAYRLITDLCSAFNGMGFWAGSQVCFTQDAPTDPSMVYTPANVVDGLFQYSGSSRKDRHSCALIRWTDPEQNYKQAVEYVEDADAIQRFGVRKIETLAFGCTTRGQAARLGRWMLYTEQYQSDLIQFRVGGDSALVLPGDVIKIHDTARTGKRMGGRLVSATLTTATLDAPVTLAPGGLATISIRMPDGTFVDRKVIESGQTYTLTDISWSEPLPALPVANAIWIMADASVEPVLARVVSIGQDDKGYAITAVEHNVSKYDAIEKGLRLEKPKNSIISTAPPAKPENVNFSEAPYVVAPGLAGISVIVSWSSNAPSFEVSWKRTGQYVTNWQTVMSSTPSIELENVRAGDYQFKIVALSGFGVRSELVEAVYTTVGKAAAPGDVANFQVVRRNTDLLLTWDAVTDIHVRGYEVRAGQTWDSGAVLITDFAGTALPADQDNPGTYSYHIRSISGGGTYSDNVTSTTISLEAPAPVDGFDVIQAAGRLELVWRPNAEPAIVYYEVREGDTWASGQMIGQVKSTKLSIPSGNIGARKFWIKAVASPGIYSSEATWVTGEVALPANSNVVVTSDQKALAWPGNRLNLVPSGSDLQMAPGVTRAEYVWSIDLLDTYRGRNSISPMVTAILNDTDTVNWGTAAFNWASSDAARHWAPNGDLTSLRTRLQISRRIGLAAGTVDAWSLDASLMSYNSVAASSSVGATYETGRFANGLRVKGGVTVDWTTLSIPSTFSYSAWIVPKQIGNSSEVTVLELGTDAGAVLRLSYDEVTGEFVLSDNLGGDEARALLTISAGDIVAFAVVQTATARRIMVGLPDKTPAFGQTSAAPVGNITKMRLYWS